MHFRVIRSPAQDGAVNMATDHAIMEAVGDGRVLPTLRFYRWRPPCLSLGYAQRNSEADFERLRAKGWGVVRRPTGGRAILHTDELTYSLCIPQEHPLATGDILTSYRRLSKGLQVGLGLLGIETASAPYQKMTSAQKKALGPVCFDTPSAYEITFKGRKLIGSAQLRRQKAVLQHGSLPLYGDLARICDALTYPDERQREAAREMVRASALTAEAALNGRAPSWETAADALQQGFGQVFGINFVTGDLTPDEALRLESLKLDPYNTDTWTYKR